VTDPISPVDLYEEIDRAAAEHEEWLISSRLWLHAHPELSNREEQTAAYVAAQLRELGLDEVRTGIAGHGVVGVLRGGLPGERVIALRADMDALPVEAVDGIGPVSHACGHDCHAADDAALRDNVRVHAHVAVDHLLGILARVPR